MHRRRAPGGPRRRGRRHLHVLARPPRLRRGGAARDPAVHVLGHTERGRGRGARPAARRGGRAGAHRLPAAHVLLAGQAPMALGGPVHGPPGAVGVHRRAARRRVAGPGRHQHLDGLGDRPLRSGAPGLGSRDARRGGPRRAAPLPARGPRSGPDAPRALGEPVAGARARGLVSRHRRWRRGQRGLRLHRSHAGGDQCRHVVGDADRDRCGRGWRRRGGCGATGSTPAAPSRAGPCPRAATCTRGAPARSTSASRTRSSGR